MEKVYTPVALPGCCFICRGAQRDSYIDTGVSLDYEGAFYVCSLCVNEMAHWYSYISPDEHKELRAAKEELEAINYELIKRVGALEESLRALANAGYRSNNDGSVVRDGGYFHQTVEIPGTEPSERTEKLGAGEGEITESVHDEGMDELHSDESDSDFKLEF